MSRVPQEAIYPKTPIDDILAAEEAELIQKIAQSKGKQKEGKPITTKEDLSQVVTGKKFSTGVIGQNYERHASGLELKKPGEKIEIVDPNAAYIPDKDKLDSGLDLDIPN